MFIQTCAKLLIKAEMLMFKYSAREVADIANFVNFNKNVCEKVLRLCSVLDFISRSEISAVLALKGGTAINLFLLDLPRLSVDADFDFCLPSDKEAMLSHRMRIDFLIRGFMENEGYELNGKSKFSHALDSYVYSYFTLFGSRDVLKIEINYSDRVHVLKPVLMESRFKFGAVTVNCLSAEELIGSKINAMLVRTTPRDVYDVFNLLKGKKIQNRKLVKKIAIFYACLGSELPVAFANLLSKATQKIKSLDYPKIRATLLPMLRRGIQFNASEMIDCVLQEIGPFFVLDEKDCAFINKLNNKVYMPDVLFDGYETENVSNHPMGLWKTK